MSRLKSININPNVGVVFSRRYKTHMTSEEMPSGLIYQRFINRKTLPLSKLAVGIGTVVDHQEITKTLYEYYTEQAKRTPLGQG